MTDDASTAYICIYCPFNSDNLQSLENHLTNVHGNQDGQPSQSSPSNSLNKTNKREAPEDEQSQTSFDGIEQNIKSSMSVKRAKRTLSPLSSNNVIVNGHQDETDHDEEEEEDDERDSSMETKSIVCPTCGVTCLNFAQLLQHAQQKHQIDLSNILSTLANVTEMSHVDPTNDTEKSPSEEQAKTCNSLLVEPTSNLSTTACPYCDFKTIDIEQFKSHIIAHIRDKNYRCLLCNRLYKYRGDCSFHIRRKHHRYSANFNDYIQRFVFDTSDGDEQMSTQIGGPSSMINGSTNLSNSTREQEEPARYFGCPYCDYTSNYGGDVRKHQARKHPNVESKVIKIVRQDSEQQSAAINRSNDNNDEEEEDELEPDNLNQQAETKTTKFNEKNPSNQHPTPIPILSNFAPVRVFQCSACQQQGTYKWVVERHIRAKHPDQIDAHVIELPAELSVKLQKITSPLKRFRCSLCSLQSKHSWVVMRHIKHFHTLQTASVLDIQPDGKPINESALTFANGDLSNKSHSQDSESSSLSSRPEIEDDPMEISPSESMSFNYKCSLCDVQSNISWNIQKHINDKHPDQSNAFVLTQCRQTKFSPNDSNSSKINVNKSSKQKSFNGQTRSLSPASALAKAKFSPVVEEALLQLQGSKLNRHLYAVQPKFGIKRLKCRHCFYRSNWKTDMIRHVRIRHNLTEPDHHKDMIMMTEQEARATIESYENTFGKELRRRTFRTWNDWAKAEQEFTPKDGSLQYTEGEGGSPSNKKTPKTSEQKSLLPKQNIKKEIQQISINKTKTSIVKPETLVVKDEVNLVSCLLPSSNEHSDDAPLDLSLKPTNDVKTEFNEQNQSSSEDEEENNIHYLCSVCPYKRRNWSSVQRHLSVHLDGQGWVCPFCSYTVASETSMIRHLTLIHPTSPIPRKFPRALTILGACVIELHQCSLCSYQCDRADALILHRQMEHEEQLAADDHNDDDDEEEEFDIDSSDGDEENDLSIATTRNLYECPLCSPSSDQNNSTNLEELTMHVINHHHNQSCPFCSFTSDMNSSQTLIQHVKLHFNGTLIQPDPIVALEQVKELVMFE